MKPEVAPSDYINTALRSLHELREHLQDVQLTERELIMREIAQGETSLRRALHLIGGHHRALD